MTTRTTAIGLALSTSTLCAAALLTATACTPQPVPDPTPPGAESSASTPAPASALHPDAAPILDRLAAEYRSWTKVDERAAWAPMLCAPARIPNEAEGRISSAEGAALHGQKLYFLFATRADLYTDPERPTKPAGFTIVKEAWAPAEVAAEKLDRSRPFAWREEKVYQGEERVGLFAMIKVEEGRGDSDAGWVYAVLDKDGRRLEAGNLSQCSSCHRNAEHDRLFGPLPGVHPGRP